MRIKCKDCKTVLIDTEKGIENYVLARDLDVKFSEEPDLNLKPEVRWGELYVICKMCGRKVEAKKVEELGVRLNKDDWLIYYKPKGGEHDEWS